MNNLARIAAIAVIVLLIAAAGCSRVKESSEQPAPGRPALSAANRQTDRPIYRHSVIPGGVVSASELKDATSRDAVVADHYRDMPAGRLQPGRSSASFAAYVSYRKHDGVYWTRHKIKIPRGELVLLSNGEPAVRARCGNRISTTPRQPVLPSGLEPLAVELDQVENRIVEIESVGGVTSRGPASHLLPLGSNRSQSGGETSPGPAAAAMQEAASTAALTGAAGTGNGWVPFDRGNRSPSVAAGAEPITSESLTEWPALPSYSGHPFDRPLAWLKVTAEELVTPPGNVRPAQLITFPTFDRAAPTSPGTVLNPTDLVSGSLISPIDETGSVPGDPGPAQGAELAPGPGSGADPVLIPEPSSLLLFASGLAVLFLAVRRQRPVTGPVGARPKSSSSRCRCGRGNLALY